MRGQTLHAYPAKPFTKETWDTNFLIPFNPPFFSVFGRTNEEMLSKRQYISFFSNFIGFVLIKFIEVDCSMTTQNWVT